MGIGGAGRGFDDQSVATAAVDEAVAQLSAHAEADLSLSSTGGTLTADGTEQTLYRDNEPLGCWMGRTLYVDLDNMQAGDTTEIRVYYRIRDAGNLQQQHYASYAGLDGGLANGNKLIAVTLGPNRHGGHVTLKQTAGVNRDYDWEFFAEV